MNEYNKLLFAGPYGAGKTTAIRAISPSQPVSTETTISGNENAGAGDKSTTTVAMDYSYLTLDGSVIHLYGMPGQDRLGFMRKILVEGAIGVILLLDASKSTLNNDAHHWLSSLRELCPSVPTVIGVTKVDQAKSFSLNTLRQTVNQFSISSPILTIDAREKFDIQQLIKMVLALSETCFKEPAKQ